MHLQPGSAEPSAVGGSKKSIFVETGFRGLGSLGSLGFRGLGFRGLGSLGFSSLGGGLGFRGEAPKEHLH